MPTYDYEQLYRKQKKINRELEKRNRALVNKLTSLETYADQIDSALKKERHFSKPELYECPYCKKLLP
ncbi:MAG: hypothetical protein DRN30_00760 [Thermoplasmata archaeon]|nr:MAG: hypothetical protein DRN30_00760 [Thermoplasmata archaeon]